MSYQANPVSLFDRLWADKWRFFATFFVVFTVSYGVLFAFDWLPEAPTTESNKATTTVATTSVVSEQVVKDEVSKPVAELPIRILIPSLSRSVTVLNPETRDIVELDAALLKGVVRHPDSAKLGEEGNVLILGHSSYLPNVMNKNFQAFNGIQKLKWGEVIEVESAGKRYTYRVDKVYQSNASEVTIPTDVSGQRLTLVTCNSFGSKEDRFIVEAKLISEKTI